MKITHNENIFLLSLVANMLLTISLINVYENYKQLKKKQNERE
tara:strand:+ start:163 stop:291 length:129 start_codon:yes stop_codon:yes gene_type:complete